MEKYTIITLPGDMFVVMLFGRYVCSKPLRTRAEAQANIDLALACEADADWDEIRFHVQ